MKTFIFGIVFGVAAAAAALYAYPAVDQHREASIVSVAANGTNVESFHINMPMDRIMAGAADQARPLPEGLLWPDDEIFRDIRAELFKIRDARDIVVGIASRTVANEGSAVIDWVLHLPARGSMFVSMRSEALPGGFREGSLRAGSREFSSLQGSMKERWVANQAADRDEPAGRIELVAAYSRSEGALQ